METALVFIAEVHGTQVVYIGTFYVHDFTEQALSCHIQRGQGKGVIAAVFQHDAVAAGALGSVHQLPAFGYGHGSGHFDGNMLALLHGVGRHRGMCQPVRTYNDEVDIGITAHLLPAVFSGITGCSGMSAFCQYGLPFCQVPGAYLTQRFDLYVLYEHITL